MKKKCCQLISCPPIISDSIMPIVGRLERRESQRPPQRSPPASSDQRSPAGQPAASPVVKAYLISYLTVRHGVSELGTLAIAGWRPPLVASLAIAGGVAAGLVRRDCHKIWVKYRIENKSSKRNIDMDSKWKQKRQSISNISYHLIRLYQNKIMFCVKQIKCC